MLHSTFSSSAFALLLQQTTCYFCESISHGCSKNIHRHMKHIAPANWTTHWVQPPFVVSLPFSDHSPSPQKFEERQAPVASLAELVQEWEGHGPANRSNGVCINGLNSWKQTHLKDFYAINLVQMIPLTSPASWYDDCPGWLGWPKRTLPTFYCAPKDRPGRSTTHHFLAGERNHAQNCRTAKSIIK